MAQRIAATATYRPSDRLYTSGCSRSRSCRCSSASSLSCARLQGVSLRYTDELDATRGFALSEDLPLIGGEFLPPERGTAVGAVDDARPDRWGERVIRFIDKPQRLSVLEYLYFAGDDRFGALGVSTSAASICRDGWDRCRRSQDADELHELIRKVQANEPVPDAQKRLISPGRHDGRCTAQGAARTSTASSGSSSSPTAIRRMRPSSSTQR